LRRLVRRLSFALLWTAGGLCALVGLLLLTARGAAAWRERIPRERLMPATGRLVPAGDGRLYVQEAGPRNGQAVVLLHGTGAWSEIWRPVMTTLSASGFRAIAVDLPPFGFSDRSPSADYAQASQARRLWAALDALEVESVILVGHSFGARATVAAALTRPARVVRLVLIDAALGLSAAPQLAELPTSARIVRAALGATALRDAVVAATLTNPLMTRTLVGLLVAHPDRLTTEQVAMLQWPARQQGTTRAAGAWLPAFVLDPGQPPAETRAALAAFPAPTHVIWGELDTLTPMRDGLDIARGVRCASWDVLPGTGHIPGLEAPEALSRTLLARLKGPATCAVDVRPRAPTGSGRSAAPSSDGRGVAHGSS
jgi:pimeloyl-ACP methyl ester carboxylesterase